MRRCGSNNRRRPPEWPPCLHSRIARKRVSRIGRGCLSRKLHASSHSREAVKMLSGQPRHKPPFSKGGRSTGIRCKRRGKRLNSVSSKRRYQGKLPRSRDVVKGKTRCVNKPPLSKGVRPTGIKCKRHGKRLNSVSSKRLHNINSKPPRNRVAVRGRRRSGTQVTGTVRVRDETSNFVMTLTAAF